MDPDASVHRLRFLTGPGDLPPVTIESTTLDLTVGREGTVPVADKVCCGVL